MPWDHYVYPGLFHLSHWNDRLVYSTEMMGKLSFVIPNFKWNIINEFANQKNDAEITVLF